MMTTSDRLHSLFNPQSIAFVGASNNLGKWGGRIFLNLVKGGFGGRLYPVNMGEDEVLGRRAFRNLEELPEVPDLAVVVIPSRAVVGVLEDCVRLGVKVVVVITAGFAEVGEEGRELQQAMAGLARRGDMLLVGPNCNGIMNPSAGLYSVMPPIFPAPGPIAVVSQSGNVGISIVRRFMAKGFGLSRYVSIGNVAHLNCEDYLEYLGTQPDTRVILVYLEGIKDGRRFVDVVRRVNRVKPVVVVKGGETADGARAAMSHTASLAGSERVFESLCRQTGMIKVSDLEELVNSGVAALGQPLPRGKRVMVVTGGGGWGVLAADACAEAGLELVALPEETLSALDKLLPPWWNRGNPVDLVAGTGREFLIKCVQTALECPAADSVILLGGLVNALPDELVRPTKDIAEWRRCLSAQAPGALAELFRHFQGLSRLHGKPMVMAAELPFADVELGGRIAAELGKIDAVCYDSPREAVAALAGLVGRARALADWHSPRG